MKVQYGTKKYRLDTAVSFLLSSARKYVKDIVFEIKSTNPDPHKVSSGIAFAHANVLSLEGVVEVAMKQGVRVEEEDLCALKLLHEKVHGLVHTVLLRILVDDLSSLASRPERTVRPQDLN